MSLTEKKEIKATFLNKTNSCNLKSVIYYVAYLLCYRFPCT